MSMNEATALIENIDNDIDTEIERTNRTLQNRNRRLTQNQLNEISMHTAALLKIKASLTITSGILNSGDISDARWHKARRGSRGR